MDFGRFAHQEWYMRDDHGRNDEAFFHSYNTFDYKKAAVPELTRIPSIVMWSTERVSMQNSVTGFL